MPVTVNVPGVGKVHFPDGMTEAQIASEVERLSPQTQQSTAPLSTPADLREQALQMPTFSGEPYDAEGRMAYAKEHPVETAAQIAVPAAVGAAWRYGMPIVRAAAPRVAAALENPLVGAGIGAAEGWREEGFGVPGIRTVVGAGLGASGSTHVGNFLRRVGLVPRPTAPVAPPPAPKRLSIIEGMSQVGRPKAENLSASARMVAGMSQPKPTPPPGARLQARSGEPTMENAIADALQELRTPPVTRVTVKPSAPSGGGFTSPPDIPLDKAGTRRIAPFAKNARARMRELSTKTVLTPAEAQELARLEQIVKQQAQAVGTTYAAGGK